MLQREEKRDYENYTQRDATPRDAIELVANEFEFETDPVDAQV